MISRMYVLNRLIGQSLTLHLFGNDRQPAEGDSIADYESLSYPGYAPQSIDKAGWTLDARGAVHRDFTFGLSVSVDAVQVYGYLITDSKGTLVVAERLENAPFTMMNMGDKVTIQPRLLI